MTDKHNWALRTLLESELDALYEAHIQADFPSAERPSLPAMHLHMQKGLQEILIMHDGGEDAAYAVCAQANGIALITLLAVFPDKRGGGVGAALLALLKARYANSRAIVLEVEDPQDAADEDERATRLRRIAFYERGGYRFLDGIDHVSFGVRLLLMAHPLRDTHAAVRATAIEDMRAMYQKILPERLWPRVTTKALPG